MRRRQPIPALFPYTTLFRSADRALGRVDGRAMGRRGGGRRPSRLGQGRWTSSSDRKSTRLNSSHVEISYAVFCLKKKREKAVSEMLPDYVILVIERIKLQ